MPAAIPAPETLDALLERIAERTSTLRADVDGRATHDLEQPLLADLAHAAAQLRDACTQVSLALGGVLDDPRRPRRDANGGAPPPASVRRPSLPIDPLTRFAIRRGTDKWGPHFYTPVYHELFSHLRLRPLRILEVGVGGQESTLVGGASLLMWADYFPHARIVGIDIVEKRLAPHQRITILRGDQVDTAFLAAVIREHGPFDIVIDDGSHVPKEVAATFGILFPAVAPDGFYVIEDVQTAFWPQFGGSPADGAETMALAVGALKGLHHAEIQVVDPEFAPPPAAQEIRTIRAYHNLLVFQRGDNREPSTRRYRADDEHVVRALALMEAELADEPTPDGLAQLARTYRLAGRDEAAVEVVERGLAQWPDHVHLLLVGVKAARANTYAAQRGRYLERLGVVAGDDPQVRDLLRKEARA